MKKLITLLLVSLGLTVVAASERPAQAQYVPVTYCCDQYDVKRCVIPPGPTGLVCYCTGIPGSGVSCW